MPQSLRRNVVPQQAAVQKSTPPADFDEAAYRKLDQTLSLLRARNAREYAIDSKNRVEEAICVHIGGIDQRIAICGENRSNAVLLFVHGGPGDVTNPWSFAYFAAWENRFTIVQWDQRGAGRTLAKTGLVEAMIFCNAISHIALK